MRKKALLSGITGQDGSYLAEFLLDKGYEVHGIVRRSSSFNTKRIDHLYNSPIFGKDFFTHYGDVTDPLVISQLVAHIQPHEVYNLAAQSHVKVSFEIPGYTAQVDALGTLNVLEAVRNHAPEAKVYQASTSEMFGGQIETMPKNGFNETTPLNPRSPYGCAKVYSYWICRNYRDSYNMFISNGMLFNHESPRRGETFVTRKITVWFADYIARLLTKQPIVPCVLGNLDAYRDWSHAKDCVEAQWLILQQQKAEDFVIASGETHSIREFITKCFSMIGKEIEWDNSQGKDKEVGRCDGHIVIQVDPKYYRPSEVDYLLGDASKARNQLNWTPKYTFETLIEEMVQEDVKTRGFKLAGKRL